MEHFGKQDVNSVPKTLNEQVIMDLRKCGHMLHHNRDLNANNILNSFSEDELNKLHELLSKFYNSIH